MVGMKTIDQNDINVGEARTADHIIRDAGFKLDRQMEYVLVQSPTKTATDPAFRAVVDQAIAKLESFPKVTELRSPFAKGNEGQISDDGHAVLIQFSPKGTYDEAAGYIDEITAGTEQVQTSNPGVHRRAGRLGVDRQGARRDVRLAARARRDDLDPDHARDPDARLRLARRRADPARARAHRRDGDDGPRRPPEPDRADGRGDLRGDPPDRARRRRRLLALLHPSRAGRATRRDAASRPRSRRPRPRRDAPCSSPASR